MTHTNLSSDSERLDIVDENDIVIGQCDRKKSYTHKHRVRIAHIFIMNRQDNTIAICRRAAQLKFCPLGYSYSAGGYIGTGEDPSVAASRELFEEIGVQTDLRLIHKGPVTDPKDGHHFVEYIYIGHASPDMLSVSEREVDSVHWLTLFEVRQLLETDVPRHPLLDNGLQILAAHLQQEQAFKPSPRFA